MNNFCVFKVVILLEMYYFVINLTELFKDQRIIFVKNMENAVTKNKSYEKSQIEELKLKEEQVEIVIQC